MTHSICIAIDEQRLLRFVYKGYRRTVEPHVYGADRLRHDILSAYQVDGGSESGERHGWKTFHVDAIQDLDLLDRRFKSPRPEYQRDDGIMATIYCQL